LETPDGARNSREGDEKRPIPTFTTGDLALREAIGGRDEDPLLGALKEMVGDDGSFMPDHLALEPEDTRPQHDQLSDTLHDLLGKESETERGQPISLAEVTLLGHLADAAQARLPYV
jgi:hypothetical protein